MVTSTLLYSTLSYAANPTAQILLIHGSGCGGLKKEDIFIAPAPDDGKTVRISFSFPESTNSIPVDGSSNDNVFIRRTSNDKSISHKHCYLAFEIGIENDAEGRHTIGEVDAFAQFKGELDLLDNIKAIATLKISDKLRIEDLRPDIAGNIPVFEDFAEWSSIQNYPPTFKIFSNEKFDYRFFGRRKTRLYIYLSNSLISLGDGSNGSLAYTFGGIKGDINIKLTK